MASSEKPASIEDSEEVVHISSGVSGGSCRLCSGGFGDGHFESQVNHYLRHGGARLLHVGHETTTDYQDRLVHNTVAVIAIRRAMR